MAALAAFFIPKIVNYWLINLKIKNAPIAIIKYMGKSPFWVLLPSVTLNHRLIKYSAIMIIPLTIIEVVEAVTLLSTIDTKPFSLNASKAIPNMPIIIRISLPSARSVSIKLSAFFSDTLNLPLMG